MERGLLPAADPLAVGTLRLQLRIEGMDESVEIDTGANDPLSFSSDRFDRFLSIKKLPVISTPALTAVGTLNFRIVRLPSLEVAGLHYEKLLLSETKSGSLMGQWNSSNVTLPHWIFPEHWLYLKPGKELARQDESNMCGIRPASIQSQVVAKFVDPASPAFEAGVRAGDVLLEVNESLASGAGENVRTRRSISLRRRREGRHHFPAWGDRPEDDDRSEASNLTTQQDKARRSFDALLGRSRSQHFLLQRAHEFLRQRGAACGVGMDRAFVPACCVYVIHLRIARQIAGGGGGFDALCSWTPLNVGVESDDLRLGIRGADHRQIAGVERLILRGGQMLALAFDKCR